MLKNSKNIGYFFRLGSIISFGFFSIVGKYLLESVNTLERVGISTLLISFFIVLPILFFKLKTSKYSIKTITSKINRHLLFLMITSLFFQIFYFLSANYIPASHTALYLTLAPLIALLLNYLFSKGYQQGIFAHKWLSFFLFSLATMGSIFVFMGKAGSSIVYQGVMGELFAVGLIFVDILYAIALINYFKQENRFTPFEATLFLMFFSAIFLSPMVGYHLYQNGLELIKDNFWSLSLFSIILLFMYYFIMESYMRCNGLINYLLMNFFPIGVMILEYMFFDLEIGFNFLFGAFLIILSSILVEVFNSKFEKNSKKLSVE